MKMVTEIKILLLLSISLHHVWCTERSCQWSKRTIQYVVNCPTTIEEVEKAANIKNCEALAEKQNCTDPSKFKYHCLINEEGDSLVEVCAPEFYIHGFCTEFNVKGLLIQAHFNLKCNNITPCSQRYLSSLAYQFPKCYDAVKKHTMLPLTNETSTILFNSTDSTTGDKVYKWILPLSFVVTALLVTTFAVCTGRYHMKQAQIQHDVDNLSAPGGESKELLSQEYSKEKSSHLNMDSDSISRESLTDEIVVVAPGKVLKEMYKESEEEREQFAEENEDHTRSYLNAFRHFDKYFVETQVFKDCKRKLEKDGVAVLVGPPGYGKTNIAIGILRDAFYKDWIKRKIKSWAEFRFINSNKNSIIYIDNIFDGFMYHHELEKWWNMLNTTFYQNIAHKTNGGREESGFLANEGGRIHLLITAKESVLTKAREYNKIKKTPVFKRNCIVNAGDHGFKPTEKDEIFDRQLEYAEEILGIPKPLVDQEFREKMKLTEGPIGFPLCAHLFACEKEHRNIGIDFFVFPINYLRKQIKFEIESDDTHSVKTLLLLLFLSECLSLSFKCEEKLDIRDSEKCIQFLKKYFSGDMVKEFEPLKFQDLTTVANKLTVTILRREEECIYQFKHQIIFDAVGFYFCTECFDVAIKYFPINAFQRHEFINPLVEFCDSFASRIITEVNHGNISEAFSCASFKQYCFAQRFCEILKGKHDLQSFLLTTDAVSAFPLPSVFWITKYKHITLSRMLYELVQKDVLEEHTFYLARFGDCCANDENFLRKTDRTVFNSTTEIRKAVLRYKNHKGMTVLNIILTSERPDYDTYLIIKRLLEDCKSSKSQDGFIADSEKELAVNCAASEVRYSRILCILALFDSKIDISKDISLIHTVLEVLTISSCSIHLKLEMLVRVCLFIIYGVDPKKKSNEGRSAKDMCRNANCTYLQELLCSKISKNQDKMSKLIQTLLRELPFMQRNEKAIEVPNPGGRLNKSLMSAVKMAVNQLAEFVNLSEGKEK